MQELHRPEVCPDGGEDRDLQHSQEVQSLVLSHARTVSRCSLNTIMLNFTIALFQNGRITGVDSAAEGKSAHFCNAQDMNSHGEINA